MIYRYWNRYLLVRMHRCDRNVISIFFLSFTNACNCVYFQLNFEACALNGLTWAPNESEYNGKRSRCRYREKYYRIWFIFFCLGFDFVIGEKKNGAVSVRCGACVYIDTFGFSKPILIIITFLFVIKRCDPHSHPIIIGNPYSSMRTHIMLSVDIQIFRCLQSIHTCRHYTP